MLRVRHARKVAAAVSVLGLVGVAFAGCSRGDDPAWRAVADRRERQARAAAADAGLPAPVQDLLGAAARAPAATFSATYLSGAERVVVHQVPPRRRVDVVVGGLTRESLVADGKGGTVRCERPAGSPWTCRDEDGAAGSGGTIGAFSPELVARTVEALEDGAAAFRTDVHELTVAGVLARCLRSTPVDPAAGAPAQLCVAPDGVPLLLDRGDGSPLLRALAYRPTASVEDVARPDR